MDKQGHAHKAEAQLNSELGIRILWMGIPFPSKE